MPISLFLDCEAKMGSYSWTWHMRPLVVQTIAFF